MQRLFDRETGAESAYVMINCETGTEPKVIDGLGTIEEVKEIKYTFGSYDIVAKIEADSLEKLREVITLKIRKMEPVRSTTTLICKEIGSIIMN